MRIGIVAGTPNHVATAALIGRIAKQTAAMPVITDGAADPLLASLDAGMLDLVIGAFAQNSPLATEIAFAPPARNHTRQG